MKFCPVCGTEYADDVKFCPRDGQTLRSSDPTGGLMGQVIADRYHITKKLGEGGMGAVYLAEHVKMGRMSAIKVMGASMMNDPEAISRFNREAANASRINHPNVCAVYDFGETEDGLIYLAMEFIEGQSLSDLLKDTGPLPLPRATAILRQTADALQAAHDLGIVHRDLKPDNIMVISQKGKDVVKVVDFGIAKAVGGEGGQKVTKTGLVVGTPEYMSPEQLSGDTLDGRSDIYSLALVFYRMITGTLPFMADTAQETMIKRLTDEPVPLAQSRPDLTWPAALQPVMDRALARWPAERVGSAVEFAAGVAQVVEGRASTKVSATEAKTQMLRPQEAKTTLTKAPPPTRVSPAPKKGLSPAVLGVAVVVLALAGGGYLMRGTLFGGAGPDSTVGQDSSQQGGGTPGGGGDTLLANSDTARPGPRNGGQDTGRRNPPNPNGTQRDTSRTDPPPTPPVDVAGLNRELFALQDDVLDNPGRRPAVRSRAEAIYRMSNAPDSLRAKAAFTVYLAHFNDQDFGQARTWIDRALALSPGHSTYERAKAGIP